MTVFVHPFWHAMNLGLRAPEFFPNPAHQPWTPAGELNEQERVDRLLTPEGRVIWAQARRITHAEHLQRQIGARGHTQQGLLHTWLDCAELARQTLEQARGALTSARLKSLSGSLKPTDARMTLLALPDLKALISPDGLPWLEEDDQALLLELMGLAITSPEEHLAADPWFITQLRAVTAIVLTEGHPGQQELTAKAATLIISNAMKLSRTLGNGEFEAAARTLPTLGWSVRGDWWIMLSSLWGERCGKSLVCAPRSTDEPQALRALASVTRSNRPGTDERTRVDCALMAAWELGRSVLNGPSMRRRRGEHLGHAPAWSLSPVALSDLLEDAREKSESEQVERTKAPVRHGTEVPQEPHPGEQRLMAWIQAWKELSAADADLDAIRRQAGAAGEEFFSGPEVIYSMSKDKSFSGDPDGPIRAEEHEASSRKTEAQHSQPSPLQLQQDPITRRPPVDTPLTPAQGGGAGVAQLVTPGAAKKEAVKPATRTKEEHPLQPMDWWPDRRFGTGEPTPKVAPRDHRQWIKPAGVTALRWRDSWLRPWNSHLWPEAASAQARELKSAELAWSNWIASGLPFGSWSKLPGHAHSPSPALAARWKKTLMQARAAYPQGYLGAPDLSFDLGEMTARAGDAKPLDGAAARLPAPAAAEQAPERQDWNDLIAGAAHPLDQLMSECAAPRPDGFPEAQRPLRPEEWAAAEALLRRGGWTDALRYLDELRGLSGMLLSGLSLDRGWTPPTLPGFGGRAESQTIERLTERLGRDLVSPELLEALMHSAPAIPRESRDAHFLAKCRRGLSAIWLHLYGPLAVERIRPLVAEPAHTNQRWNWADSRPARPGEHHPSGEWPAGTVWSKRVRYPALQLAGSDLCRTSWMWRWRTQIRGLFGRLLPNNPALQAPGVKLHAADDPAELRAAADGQRWMLGRPLIPGSPEAHARELLMLYSALYGRAEALSAFRSAELPLRALPSWAAELRNLSARRDHESRQPGGTLRMIARSRLRKSASKAQEAG